MSAHPGPRTLRAGCLALVLLVGAAPAAAKDTLYERLGERDGIERLVDAFRARGAKNPITVARLKGANGARIRTGLIELLSELGGGPDRYRGLPMLEAHRGMALTDEEFDAFMENWALALADVGVADRDRRTILGFFEAMRPDVVEGPKTLEDRVLGIEAQLMRVERRLAEIDRKLDRALALLEAGARAEPGAGPTRAAAPEMPPAPRFDFDPAEKAAAPKLVERYARGTNEDRERAHPLIGRRLPHTRFVDATGRVLDLRSFEGKRRVVLVIMRGFAGTVCIHCSAQTLALSDAVPAFRERNAEVVLVYPGAVETLTTFIEAVRSLREGFDIPFRIALDVDLLAVRELRIEGSLAKPTSIVLDEAGVVRHVYVGQQPADRPSASELLGWLDELE